MKNIKTIIKKYKWQILLIYVYIFFKESLTLIEPYFLGKAIDGIISGEYFYLWVLLVTYLTDNLFMYKQMIYDTKVYMSIYNDIIFDYLEREISADSSSKIARMDMTQSIVGFFEHELHYFMMAVMTIIGSMYFIFIQHALTGFVVLLCAPFIILIVHKFYGKISQVTRVANTHYEQKIKILESEDKKQIHTFFKRRKKVIVAESTLQGRHWASINSVKSIFLVASVFIYTNRNIGLTHGQAVSIYAYINNVLISIMSVPVAVETYTRIKDILRRLNTETNE